MTDQPDMFLKPEPEPEEEPEMPLTWADLDVDLPDIASPRQATPVRMSELSIYLDWLDEIRVLLCRHGDQDLEAWAVRLSTQELGDEMHAVADGFEEIAGDLRNIANAVGYAQHCTDKRIGGSR